MPGLNWCQLINFWCHLINIWGHVLLTIFQNTNTIASTNTNTHNLSMTLPAHSSIIRIQMQSCPHYPLQLEYRAREYRRMQGINYEALNALSPTRPQLSLFWQSPVCVICPQFGCSCFACNRKTRLEPQDTKYMKEWQKVFFLQKCIGCYVQDLCKSGSNGCNAPRPASLSAQGSTTPTTTSISLSRHTPIFSAHFLLSALEETRIIFPIFIFSFCLSIQKK